MRKLRIGIRLFGIDTFDPAKPGNIQGDELVARGWKKYLERHEAVEVVHLYGARGAIAEPLDALIHFHPELELQPGTKNLLYLQNAFPKEHYPGGTAGVFSRVKDRFDGFFFPSEKLMRACAPGGVVPFCTDPEMFFPQPEEVYQVPVSFVGNDIRGPVVNRRYLVPAMPFGLVVYGNNWSPPLSEVSRGKLPMPDLPKLYSGSRVNLNAHLLEHVEWETINLRIFDILACGGFIVSDHFKALSDTFGDALVYTSGNEDLWAKLVHFLNDPAERARRAQEGRRLVLGGHTYQQRMQDVVTHLREIL